jgi:GMP synthase-like glutamine amidotransferase
MPVLICKNISTEGPGTITDYLKSKRAAYTTVDLALGESIPDTRRFDTLVMMGGPMSVNDDIAYIREEELLVRDFIAGGKKILGICLGAQIMAKALGAAVYKGPAPEIGWMEVELDEEGIGDPLMKRLTADMPDDANRKLPVFQWHGETFDIPAGGIRLASSALYPNQAFRVGRGAYGFQFHIEVDRQMIRDWMAGEKIDINKVNAGTERYYGLYHDRAMAFYEGFFS